MPVPRTKRKLRAIGVTCGIGSMLVGARQAGFDVIGNIEWRKYYHAIDEDGQNTFLSNFPGAIFPNFDTDMSEEEIESFTGADIALGHPECGNFSNLGGSNKKRLERMKDPCDIPLFVDLVAKFKPRFFVMDDLPKSFGAFSIAEYVQRLPDYDLYPEWVSNHGYSNVQKNRKRMFMLGARREERWVFVPGEVDHSMTCQDVIGDLPEPELDGPFHNHDPHELDTPSGRFTDMPEHGDRPSWAEFAEHIRSFPEGANFIYKKADGSTKVRIGSCKVRWGGSAPVLHGGNPILHPIRCLPLTIRERARIQGFPDDFVFYGTKFRDGLWNHERNLHMVKQTGKAMPIQFCRYVSEQIAAHIRGVPFESSGERILRPNPDVDNAKKWFCSEVGYSDQEKACSRCWMAATCSIRHGKYGIGDEPTVGRSPRTRTALTVQNPIILTPSTAMSMTSDRVRSPITRKIATQPTRPTKAVREVPIRTVRFSNRTLQVRHEVERVEVAPGIPEDYHCRCRFCSVSIGELIRPDGTNYNRLDRRKYYDKIESGRGIGHIAKTPLHVARWAVQEFSKPGDWVLDPTAGAGTTIVESLVQGRNAAGVELEFVEIIQANARRHSIGSVESIVGLGDTRNIRGFLRETGRKFALVQNNPPYFGDQSFPGPAKEGRGVEFRHLETTFKYDQDLPNLGLLKEGPEYWEWIRTIYQACTDFLLPGGHFVVGVKDQMRNKQPDQLHEKLAVVLESIGLELVGTAFLRHYPTTLHLNTYFKRYGVHPPYFQTILVFQKKEGKKS